MVKEPSMFNVLYTIGPTKSGAHGVAAIKKAFKVDDKKAKELLDKAIDFSSSGKIKTLPKSQQSMLNKQSDSMKEEVALDEGSKEKALKALMTKALGGKKAKPGYTSSIASNGDFVVHGGMGNVVGRLKKGEFKNPLGEGKEMKDLDTKNVDKALAHDCAKHVVHEKWGEGKCIPEMHSLEEGEDGTGFVTHYDVMFEHGVEQNVPVWDLEIVVSESHTHSKKKTMKEAKVRTIVDPKKFDAYKNHMKSNKLDDDTVRVIHQDPDHPESKRMMKNPKYAKAVSLYKASLGEEVELDEAGPKIDPAKMAAHMARNDKPKKMSSTQKSLAAIRQKSEEFDNSDEVEGGNEEPQMDPVNKKALKKKFKDRKDKDIDNDGDVDDSDKYLHMRRKAVSKALDKKNN